MTLQAAGWSQSPAHAGSYPASTMAATFVGGTLATGKRRAGDSDRQDSHVTSALLTRCQVMPLEVRHIVVGAALPNGYTAFSVLRV